jgi:NADP-dependent 3-hydroxy acid dehydrogenase YdfG
VIGAGPGLGTALARRFAERYTVAIVACKADYLERVTGEIESAGGTALPVAADVSDQAALAGHSPR